MSCSSQHQAEQTSLFRLHIDALLQCMRQEGAIHQDVVRLLGSEVKDPRVLGEVKVTGVSSPIDIPFIIKYHQYLSSISMDINGYQWNSMDINGYQWISMEFNGYQWKLMENSWKILRKLGLMIPGIPQNHHGRCGPWLSMASVPEIFSKSSKRRIHMDI